MALRAAGPKTERCPRCDAAFGCAIATGNCWCKAPKLDPERLAELAADYDGCLCPGCLVQLARGPAG